MTAQSSLQSNWKASPGANVRGTKVPRPVVWAGFMLHLSPVTCKGGDPVVRSFVAQRDEIGMDLPQVATLLTPLAGFRLEPDRQLVGKGIQLAGTLAVRVLGVNDPVAQVFADGITG